MKKTIHDKYKANYFKSNDMEDLYQNYPDPWRLAVDGHDRYKKIIEVLEMTYHKDHIFMVADIGCGEGIFCSMLKDTLPNAIVYGFDISKTAVTRSIEKFNSKATFYISDIGKDCAINDIGFYPGFDVIILGDILYYLKDTKELEHAVESLNAALKDRGTLILTEFAISKKYSNFLAQTFKKLSENRYPVRYEKTPISLEPGKELTYRMVIYTKNGG